MERPSADLHAAGICASADLTKLCPCNTRQMAQVRTAQMKGDLLRDEAPPGHLLCLSTILRSAPGIVRPSAGVHHGDMAIGKHCAHAWLLSGRDV